MNLDELRTVQMKERKKDSLQHLRDTFYADVATYIEDLKAQRSRAADQADDPFSSPEVSRLTDEIETAEEVAEAVYERRVGKVVKLASFAAADMPVDQDGMTTEERRLFDDLVARIEQNKTTVLDTLAGKHVETSGDEQSAAAETSATATSETPPSATSEPSPTDSATAGGSNERATTDATDGRATTDRESPESESGGGGMLADAMAGGDDTDGSTTPSESGESSDDRPIPPDEPPTEETASDGGSITADPGGAPADDTAPTADTERTTDDTDRTVVRITRDVGSIFGVDEREYDLSSEDVVTLPSANADPLLERDAAERID